MTEKEYRQNAAISRSQLAWIAQSPEKFKYNMDNPEEPTPSLVFGQLVHKLLLQPESFSEDFAILPVLDRRTKAGKEMFADFCEQNKGKTVVDREMFGEAERLCNAARQNPLVRRLLKGEREIPLFWSDDLTNEECKCRPDVLTRVAGKLTVVDVKTTANAESEAFQRDAVKYHYDFQCGMYSEGVEKNYGERPDFVFLVIEKDPPYAVNILKASEDFYLHGIDKFREFLGIYHDCKSTGNWWGYLGKNTLVNNLDLPAYLAAKNN